MIYDKSEIMQNAWTFYRISQREVSLPAFGKCLHRAWDRAEDMS